LRSRKIPSGERRPPLYWIKSILDKVNSAAENRTQGKPNSTLKNGVAEKQDELKRSFKHPVTFSYPDSATSEESIRGNNYA
jgi:hypothetical protein